MTIALDAPDEVPWTVKYDRQVVDELQHLSQSNGEIFDDTLKTIQKIANNPLCGSPKTGELKGFRADHITQLVIVWELDPHIVDRQHLDEVEEVYIHGIEHHDDMVDTVKGGRNPVTPRREFGVRFDDYDVQHVISNLYEVEGVNVEEENWGDEDGVTVLGYADEGAHERVAKNVPETAEMRLGKQQIPA